MDGSKKELRAVDMKLTTEQRVRVMQLVKDGKLTVDEAMDKVLKVEQEIDKSVSLESHMRALCIPLISTCTGFRDPK